MIKLDWKAPTLRGALLVALASLIWATDTLARYPAAGELDPLVLVFFEHLVGLTLVLPWWALRGRSRVFALRGREWLAAVAVGAGGSAVAALFFTLGVRSTGPAVASAVLKLQPLLVVGLAYAVLGEKLRGNFFPWAGVAVLSAIVVSVPDPEVTYEGTGAGIGFAAGAMAVWALSTVAGKYLLKRHSAEVSTFWRWMIGTATLALLLLVRGTPINWGAHLSDPVLPAVVYMALVPGVLATWIYYRGLRLAPASVVTFVELMNPLGGIVLSTVFLGTSLGYLQMIAAALLLLSVLLIAIPKGR